MRTELEQAQSDLHVISIEREEFEDGLDLGYVAAVGSELILLHRISDGIRFNGYSVLRIEDITDLEAPIDNARFVESALQLRNDVAGETPRIDLSDFESAIRTAGSLFEIVTLHYEVEDPTSCQIGKIRSVSPEITTLIPIDTDAEWDEEPCEIETPDVTRIDVGGEYEEALHLVGGDCPIPRLRVLD